MIIPSVKKKNILKPPDVKIVNENIYYLINKSGKDIYDNNNIYIGKSTGYSLRPTYKSSGAIEVKNTKKETFWITGNVKYIIENNYILTNFFKL